MKIFTIKLFLLLLIFQTAGAQVVDTVYIDCPGIAGGTWTPEHRYIARCNILVPYDSVLTINHGVNIEIQGGFTFRVEGQLFANGTQNDSIKIKPFSGNWKGMTFGTPSGEQNVNTSQISFMKIDCGSTSNSSEAILLGKHKIISINNIRVANAQVGARITGLATIDNITSCKFENAAQGIVFQYCDLASQVKIESCLFKKISERAVMISQNQAFLNSVIIQDCGFDNSTLANNNSGSAIYITLNNKLTSVTLNSNDISSFGMEDNSLSGIYIYNNDILDEVRLIQNEVTACGGESPTSPNADFGGLYINTSQNVFLEDNIFSDNTGKKSGAGYINTGSLYCTGNTISDNRNNYTGNENFAGAFTLTIGQRVEMSSDSFDNNISAKSGGALIIGTQNESEPIDLIFDQITLSSNSAANEGGAILINAAMDTLRVYNSDITDNFSSAGSGGCFSIISSAFNHLAIESNSMRDNFVSENSDGGFLYLRHNPAIKPVYGDITIDQNVNAGTGHTAERNYSLLYSKISSFPHSISITGENISQCYPVNDYLYHFELLESGPDPESEDVALTMTDNTYQDNRSPIFYLANDSAVITGDFQRNIVNGNSTAFGTFITIECKEAPSVNFANEQYASLVSIPSGGAVSIRATREIGLVNLNDIQSQDCFSADGDGGHFSFISENSNPAFDQKLIITNCTFSNSNNTSPSGGDGGAIHYISPGSLDSLFIRSDNFNGLESGGSGGAVFVEAKEINTVDIQGSAFDSDIAAEIGGGIYVNAENGGINKFSVIPHDDIFTTFSSCSSLMGGGALCLSAFKEIGPVLIESVQSSDCFSGDGNGGHFSFVSLNSDASLNQELVMTSSVFNTLSSTDPTGGVGGAVYFHSPGNLDSLYIRSCSFSNLESAGSGGALYTDAKEFGKITILGSDFDSDISTGSDAGAVYLEATDGSIKKVFITPYEASPSTFASCTARSNGGALALKASREIGPLFIDGAEFTNCYAIEGNGGHLSMISLSSDPAVSQEIIMSNSQFRNPGITSPSGGNGGSFYFKSPGNVDSVQINSCSFSDLKSVKIAGALFIDTKEINKARIEGSQFSTISSLDTAGAVFINAGNGSIKQLSLIPAGGTASAFTSCTSKYDGGALCIKASKEIGPVLVDSAEFTNCYSAQGNGGHLALISLGNEPSQVQGLTVSNSSFSNSGISNKTGGNGGIIYCSALSDLSAVNISGSDFLDASAIKNGGSIYLAADKILSLNASGLLFSSSMSEVLSGGALYIKSSNGLLDGSFTFNRFIDCTSNEMGGAIFIDDGKFDNATENISWTSNTYKKADMPNTPDRGGAIYCKGINSVQFTRDSAINQSASLQGGFLYLEKVYRSLVDSVHTYSNSSGEGGVVYHLGDDQPGFGQSSRIINSTFLFNEAVQTGGCFYLSGIDSIEIGRTDHKNVFVANQSMTASNSDQVGGGVFYIQDAKSLQIENNSLYVNKSANNGGVGIINTVSSFVKIEDNNFLSNQAKAGGAITFINSFADGLINQNNFNHNTADEQGGALLFSPSAASSFVVSDNTFFENNTDKLGGAVASYRPVSLIRNLFRDNRLFVENPNEGHKGTAVYLSGSGVQTLIKNCVFDKNVSPVDSIAAVYFDASQDQLPEFSISNCSFFNLDDQHRSVFNASQLNTVNVVNSIFTIRGRSRDESVTYFNESVKARYCDLIYSEINDPVNHNVDEYIYFNVGDYYFDSLQYPVDKGDPDPSFYDFHFPPAYDSLTNDIGISGGPDNPDTTGTFLFHEPVNLSAEFTVIITESHCFDYSFECRGDFVVNYEYFYWFMPDTIIRTQAPELDYSFSHDLFGNYMVTVLGHDINNAEVYGYGDTLLNLDIVRIYSLSTGFENNAIPVPSVPFQFTISSDIYYGPNTSPVAEWKAIATQGLDYTISGSLNTGIVDIQEISDPDPFIYVEYSISACGRTLRDTIEVKLLLTNQWGYPEITFYPVDEEIPDTINSFGVIFNKRMTDLSGNLLQDSDVAAYLNITNPCPGIIFLFRVEYGPNETKFIIEPVNSTTLQPDTLCDGSFLIAVNGENLVTENYRLPASDAEKSYIVTGIDDLPGSVYVRAYPNPFRDNLHIELGSRGNYLVEITDLAGIVRKTARYEDISEVNLNLTALSDGMYLLHVTNLKLQQHLNLKINKITQ